MTYKQLRQTLKDGKKLRAFPLVDNPESMILLGSIQRGELIACIGKKKKEKKNVGMINMKKYIMVDNFCVYKKLFSQNKIVQKGERKVKT